MDFVYTYILYPAGIIKMCTSRISVFVNVTIVSRSAELRSCLIESAHLVLGRPLTLFQPWMFGLKS